MVGGSARKHIGVGVLRKSPHNGARLVGRMKTFALCFALAGAATIYHTETVSYQDASELAGHSGDDRWMMAVERPAGESVVAIDHVKTASIIGPSVSMQSGVENRLKLVKGDPGAKPQTINRSIKGNRVVESVARDAPTDFSAGSVLERQSFLETLDAGTRVARSFVEPKPRKEAIKIAQAFHPKKPEYLPATEKLPVMVASLVKQSQSSITAFAPEAEVIHSPFSAVIKPEREVKIVPQLNKGDHDWADDPLPLNSFSDRQQACLARGIYFEARGEPAKGQAAVAQVILNRVRNPHYPNTICGVVYQNKNWRNRCQFSFACDRIRDRIKSPELYAIAKQIAAETSAGRIWLKEVGSSTHYHATYVNPRWNRRMKRLGRIGLHIFYRTYGGGWS